MSAPLAALCALWLSAAPAPADAPVGLASQASFLRPSVSDWALHQAPPAPGGALDVTHRQYTVEDAPTTGGVAFLASGLTSFTGLGVLIGLSAGPSTGVSGGQVTLMTRIATSLFLMSVGPSVGDLLNHDLNGFLLGAGARSLLVALSWGAIAATSQPGSDPGATVVAALFVTMSALVWMGWCAVDLVRAYFAPQRWAERQNEQARRERWTAGRPNPVEGPYAVAF